MENAIRILKEKADALAAEFHCPCEVKLSANSGDPGEGIYYHVWIAEMCGTAKTLADAESAARERNAANNPYTKLTEAAAKAGYRLVKLEAVQ